MDDNENSIYDVNTPAAATPAANKLAGGNTAPQSPELLLFAAPPATPEKSNSLTRETESNYALSKTRTLTAGVPGHRLSETVNRAIKSQTIPTALCA